MDIQFPAVALSPAGWLKWGTSMEELTDASPADDLAEWQAIEIFDAAGKSFQAKAAFRAWPKSGMGAAICRLFNQVIHVGFEWESVRTVELSELAARIGRVEALPNHAWLSHRELIEHLRP